MHTIKSFRASEIDRPLREAWRAIQDENPNMRHPLLCPEYTLAVAEVRDDVEIAVFYRESRPVGFFPYHRNQKNVANPIAEEVSDYHAIVIAADVSWDPEAVLRDLGLVAFNFHHLPVWQQEFTPYQAFTDPAYCLDLSNGYEQYAADRKRSGTSIIAQLNRKKRKLEREIGELRFEYDCQDPDVLVKLVQWKRERILSQGFPNTFRHQWVNDFIKRLHQKKSETFSGVLSSLFAGDQLIAAHLGSSSKTVLSSWIPSHSPDFESYSPGAILTLEIAKSAAGCGIERIDLGRGQNSLKTRLASSCEMLSVGELETRSLQRLVNGGVHRAKSLSHRFPILRSTIQSIRKRT